MITQCFGSTGLSITVEQWALWVPIYLVYYYCSLGISVIAREHVIHLNQAVKHLEERCAGCNMAIVAELLVANRCLFQCLIHGTS